ncbi:unnamed protein product [Orchesella dallaii]|uniref:Smr domain-containing protein n=1 Tax=Orchesella dallaii TaxID=48710 RepID=A0ABP1RRH4_9HEXA
MKTRGKIGKTTQQEDTKTVPSDPDAMSTSKAINLTSERSEQPAEIRKESLSPVLNLPNVRPPNHDDITVRGYVNGTLRLLKSPVVSMPEVNAAIEDLKSLIEEKWQQHLQTREKSRYYYQKFAERQSDLAQYYFEDSQYYTAINQNVKKNCDDKLDLHGLCRPAALRGLQEFFEFKEEEFLNAGIPKMRLLIITGRGNHSRNGIPVLHYKVGKYLRE